jgi:hypothetical protein
MKAMLAKLGLLVIATGACFSQSNPTPVASVKLNSLVSDRAIRQSHSVTVVFLSDSQLAVAFQMSPDDEQQVVTVLGLKGSSMNVIARKDGMRVSASFDGLGRTGNGQLVASTLPPSDRDVRIFDAALNETHRFHARTFHMSPTGNTLVVSPGRVWNVFTTETFSLATSLSESPLALSDDAFAIQSGDHVLVKGFDGTLKGTVSTPKKCVNRADFLGSNKLYLHACRHGWTQEIVDFSGRSLVTLHLPKGWGNHQSDSDGDRMVFDIFTESRWASIKAFKNLKDVPDGESIRVIDTSTGNTCFSLDTGMDEAHEGPMHASISPSGRFVAFADDEAISVFELPSRSCAHR